MNQKQEVVKIQLENQTPKKETSSAKVALRIKAEKHDVFVYNGANQYLIQTVLKELIAHVS